MDYDEPKDVAKVMIDKFFGGQSGSVNEFTVRQRIIESSQIFRDDNRGWNPEEIKKIEPALITGRDWMKEHNFPDSENDACWSLYLCYSRTHRESLAVTELQRIRTNIEQARSNIAEPKERARMSERYPYLYAAECALLWKLGRYKELMEAIEAGKGRALADLLTIRDGRPANEIQFVNAIKQLPHQMNRLRSHYLTTFVDDDAVYCSLVTSDKQIHACRVELTKDVLKELALARDPRLWGKRDLTNPFGPRFPSDVAHQLTPLVEWMSPLFRSGVMKTGDHLCYSPHDVLLGIPLHYVEFNGSPMVEHFSMSRIHGAHSLLEVLRTRPSRPKSYLVVEVPSVQDLDNPEKLKAFGRAGNWLRQNLSDGEQLSRKEADVATVSSKRLGGRVVHFATHGTFPEQVLPGKDPNPYRTSGLVLAGQGSLPDLMHVAKGHADEQLLTPEKIVRLKYDFSKSHVTLQACVSGLSKRGYGGDALGLEWALSQLGASSILATHWHASAQTTACFVTKFYKRWLKQRQSRGHAWRDTVLELRKNTDTSELCHWASFSLMGDWR